jgi:hypothetical protein
VEPSVDDWDDVAAVVGFVPRVDLVVAAAVDTVVRAVEPTPPMLLLGFGVALVALDKAVVVVLLGAGFDLLSLFLLLIIVDILWE